jgi:hypothetical protein
LAGLIAFRVWEGIMLVGCSIATLAICGFVISMTNDAGDAISTGGDAAPLLFAPWRCSTVYLFVHQLLGLTFKARLDNLVITGCI